MEELKLYKGLRIKFWRFEEAGGYSIARVNMFTETLINELGLGQPYHCAYQSAEDLAILVDAELTLNGDIIRKSITGEYYNE